MLSVISPAKNLNFDPVGVPATEPAFSADAVLLARAAGRLSKARLKAMMELSDSLTDLNYQRFKAFDDAPDPGRVKPAALAFNGDTYQGLAFSALNPADMDYAQAHLRILSGLYGVLRPLDGIQPYRLEMGRRLKTRRGETLYDFWRDRIARTLDAQAAAIGASHVVNLASIEYFTAAREQAMKTPVIHPVFKEDRGGALKIISFNAKRARGAMARYLVETRAQGPEDLLSFDRDGYAYRPDLSTPQAPVFVRSEAVTLAAE
ncbi:MAG: peroxide stress protein YaaA [Pseudomonadota bacterium]